MRTVRRSASAARARLRRLWCGAVVLLRLWDTREFERRYLGTLNDAQLRDMRLTRRQVREEASKPFWKP